MVKDGAGEKNSESTLEWKLIYILRECVDMDMSQTHTGNSIIASYKEGRFRLYFQHQINREKYRHAVNDKKEGH